MKKIYLILCTALALVSTPLFGQGGGAFEIRADRTIVFPQKLELEDNATLLDVLMTFPDLMQKGFDEMAGGYNLRIDNVTMSGDIRLLCSQIKASIISMVQICDNTGVAKGTIGNGRVIDVNLLKMEDGFHGFVNAQGGLDAMASPSVEMRYGSVGTDIYANASFTSILRDAGRMNNAYATVNMTNCFSRKDRLLTSLNFQSTNGKLTDGLARARYFHNFNDKGTELLILAGYQYRNPAGTVIVLTELNTPLPLKGLTLMAGYEGDHISYSGNVRVSNDDIYLQLNYRSGAWLLTLGDRFMFYRYAFDSYTSSEGRNNAQASMVYTTPGNCQIQLACHRKFSNPSFTPESQTFEEEWLLSKGTLKAAYMDELKLGLSKSFKGLTVNSSLSYLSMEDADNSLKLNVSLYYHKNAFTINGGVNVYDMQEGEDFATFIVAPKYSFPFNFQLGAKCIVSTRKGILQYGGNVYSEIMAEKHFNSRWSAQLMWHDIFNGTYGSALAGIRFSF